jgi:hypothetical protein
LTFSLLDPLALVDERKKVVWPLGDGRPMPSSEAALRGGRGRVCGVGSIETVGSTCLVLLSTGFDGRRILSGVGRWDTIFDRGGVG